MSPRIPILAPVLAACAAFVGCASGVRDTEPDVLAPPAPVAVAAAPAAPPAWEGTDELPSNAGHYVVRYRTAPDPIPWGDPFELDVWVLDPDGRPAAGVELSVDAAMPEHGHGMNRVPQVSAGEDGEFDVAGMLFHMPGKWELYFDVSRGPLTERAQIDVELE